MARACAILKRQLGADHAHDQRELAYRQPYRALEVAPDVISVGQGRQLMPYQHHLCLLAALGPRSMCIHNSEYDYGDRRSNRNYRVLVLGLELRRRESHGFSLSLTHRLDHEVSRQGAGRRVAGADTKEYPAGGKELGVQIVSAFCS